MNNKSLKNKRRARTSKGRRIEKIPASNIISTGKIPSPEQEHTIVGMSRWIDAGATYPQVSSVGTAWAFNLGQIPESSEIQAMWDFYRITQVDVCYFPASKVGPTTATTSSPGTVMAVCVDYDEQAAVNYDSLRARQNTQIFSVFDSWEVSFTPRLSSVVYGNGVTNAYALPSEHIWVDTASSVASYYGVNFAFPATTAANQFGGRLCYRVHLEFSKLI